MNELQSTDPIETEILEQASAEEAALNEPQVVEAPVQEPSPVPALGVTPQRGFFDKPTGKDFFAGMDTVSVRPPMAPQKASELALATSIAVGQDEQDAADIYETVKEDLKFVGTSGLWIDVREKQKQAAKAEAYSATFENMSFLELAQSSPEDARAIVKAIELENNVRDSVSPEARIIMDAVQRLTPEQAEIFGDTSFLMSEVLHQRAIDDTLSQFSYESGQAASVMDWVQYIGESLVGVDVLTSRAQQNDIQVVLADLIGDPEKFYLKQDSADRLREYLLDPKQSVGVLTARVESVKSVFQDLDQRGIGSNPLYKEEFFDLVLSELRNAPQDITFGEFLDVAEPLYFVDAAYTMGKLIKSMSDSIAVRVFGSVRQAQGNITAEEIEELEKLSKEVADAAAGIPKDDPYIRSLLTEEPRAPQAIPKTVVRPEYTADMKRLEELDAIAAQVGTRKERKDLEAEKKRLSAALEVDDASVKDIIRELQAEGVKFKDAQKQATDLVRQQREARQIELDNLQNEIDEFDRIQAAKAEATRIRQRMQGAPSSDVVPVVRSKLANAVSIGIRRQGSLVDTLNVVNPKAAHEMVQAAVKEGDEAVEALGLTQDDLAMRVAPTPQGTAGFHHTAVTGLPKPNLSAASKFDAEFNGLNVSDLMTEQEIQQAAGKWAKAVTDQAAAKVYATHSVVERVNDETGDLVVRAVFGKDVHSGYGSLKEAENSARYLFGLDYKVKVKVPGVSSGLKYIDEVQLTPEQEKGAQYFLEARTELRPHSGFVNPFEDNFITPVVPFSSYAQTWFKVVKSELTKLVSSYTDKATRLSTIQAQMLEPFLKMNAGKDQDDVMRLLTHGDDNQVEFGSKLEAETFLGNPMSDKAWRGYQGARDFWNSTWKVRNAEVYRHLAMNNYKSVYTDTGILSDLNGSIQVYPLVSKPARIAKPDENSSEYFVPNGVWGNKAWDTRLGKEVDITVEYIDELYNTPNAILARASREAEFVSDKRYNFVIVETDKVKQLTKTPMSYRAGHMDRNYADADIFGRGGNSYKIKASVQIEVDGLPATRDVTVGMYGSRAEAAADLAKIYDTYLDDQGLVDTPEVRAEFSKVYGEPVPTREGRRELGMDDSGTFSGVPAHARSRGEVVRGYTKSGLAELMSPADSMTRAVNETRRHLTSDAVEVMKRRFAQRYAPVMKEYNGFPSTFNPQMFQDSKVSAALIEEAGRAHRMISSLEHALANREYVMFMDRVNHYANDLKERGYGVLSGLLKVLGEAKLDIEVKKAVTLMLIGARPLFQILGNALQIQNLVIQNPVDFFAKTLPRSMAMLIFGIASTKLDIRVANVLGGAMSGMTPEQFAKHLDNFRKSGVFRSGAAQDITNLFGEAGRVEAGRHNPMSSVFWKRMVPGLGLGDRVGKLALSVQHFATDFAHVFAWNHAISKVTRDKGVDYALSRRGSNEASGVTRQLMFQQNRTDQFAYQQNAASFQLMFFQHVHRMFNDLLVDPMVRTATFNKYGISKDGSNIYARTWAESLKTMGMVSGIFGIGAYPLIDESSDNIQQLLEDQGFDKDSVSILIDGMLSHELERLTGTKFDVQSRLSPAGALQTTFEMMFTHDGGLVLGGPLRELWKTGSNVGKVMDAVHNAEPMDTAVVLQMAETIAQTALSGTNDAFRAKVVDSMQNYVDRTGKPVSQVTDTSYWPIMFSLPPSSAADVYEARDRVFSREESAIENAKFVNRMAVDMIADKKNGDADGELVMEAMLQSIRALDLIAGSDKQLAQMSKEKFLTGIVFESEGALFEMADRLIETNTPETARSMLRVLIDSNPKSKQGLEALLNSIEDNNELPESNR